MQISIIGLKRLQAFALGFTMPSREGTEYHLTTVGHSLKTIEVVLVGKVGRIRTTHKTLGRERRI